MTVPRNVLRTSLAAALIASQASLSACSAAGTKAQAQEPKPVVQAASTPLVPAAAAGTHKVKPGESPLSLARTYLSQSSLMTVEELEAAIREANHLSKGQGLKPGMEISIPTLEPQPVVEKSRPIPKDADIRAVY